MIYKLFSATSLIAACAVFASSQAVQAQTPHKKWGDSGAWSILVDPEVGNGCYMENTLEDGTLVQVGILPDRDGGFFAAYNAAWTNIEEGAAGTVQFDFEKSLFGGDYVGATKGGLPGGYAYFNNPEFIKEFGKRNNVSISGNQGKALDFKLTGTMKAINAVRNCDAEQPK